MRDDDPIPPTLAEVLEHTDGIFCWCHRCDHNVVLPLAVLIAYCGPGLPFPAVHGRLRCQACGSKDIHARPNWRGLGVVAKHGPLKFHQKKNDSEIGVEHGCVLVDPDESPAT